MTWLLWGLSMVLTQFFSTLTSRARNTSSYAYHGICAGLNHGTWLVAQTFLINSIVSTTSIRAFLVALAFYTSVSTAASIAAHYVSITYFERGKRRIGAYS